jgi:hypothetical protein
LWLWDYVDSLWKNRNSTRYSKNKEEVNKLHEQQLTEKVILEYSEYRNDPFIILYDLSFLFETQSLEDRLHMNRVSLQGWLISVA